ncbi:MAG: hypothetical protein ACREVP_18505 [Burkholderiales bacterium]
MQKRNANVLLHLAGPAVGNEVRDVLRELATLAGHARRRWAAAQLVGM